MPDPGGERRSRRERGHDGLRPRRARALYRTAESRRMSDSTKPVPVRTSFTADEIDTIYNDLWAAGYVLHCTDIEDGEVVAYVPPTCDAHRARVLEGQVRGKCGGLPTRSRRLRLEPCNLRSTSGHSRLIMPSEFSERTAARGPDSCPERDVTCATWWRAECRSAC
jgi:hypothetical protein